MESGVKTPRQNAALEWIRFQMQNVLPPGQSLSDDLRQGAIQYLNEICKRAILIDAPLQEYIKEARKKYRMKQYDFDKTARRDEIDEIDIGKILDAFAPAKEKDSHGILRGWAVYVYGDRKTVAPRAGLVEALALACTLYDRIRNGHMETKPAFLRDADHFVISVLAPMIVCVDKTPSLAVVMPEVVRRDMGQVEEEKTNPATIMSQQGASQKEKSAVIIMASAAELPARFRKKQLRYLTPDTFNNKSTVIVDKK